MGSIGCESEGRVLDAVIVGAGFAGLYMLHKARQTGLDALALEAGPDIGGVWFWNGYPGARCDVESMQYSYSFDEKLQQEWSWSEKFASRDEILRYVNHVADRFDLRRDVRLDTRVASAHFDDATGRWQVTTQAGERFECRYLLMASGCLSTARIPEIAGLESFAGEIHHTGNWPRDRKVDLAGKRVAVIGTGSSGIQVVAAIASEAAQLTVFQRTANFSVPARNQPMAPDYERSWKDNYAALRYEARHNTTAGTIYELSDRSAIEVSADERAAEFERRWEKGSPNFMRAFNDLGVNEQSNAYAADFVRDKIRTIVSKPEVAEKLAPKNHPIGSKRICVDTGYFETYNRDNVRLVDLKEEPIEAVTPTGICTARQEYLFDTIIFATGYDAITGALGAIDIRGCGGKSLKEEWKEGPAAYLGLVVSGFPNMFLITGPGSPSVLVNVIVAIEQHVEWIADCIAWMREHGYDRIDADPQAQLQWADHVDEVAHKTLFVRANSWYMGANIPGKPKRFMPYAAGIGPYTQKCLDIARQGYDGFIMSKHASSISADVA